MERNRFLECDGLFWESETHEWFNDKSTTKYAQKNSILWVGGEQADKLLVVCFVVRNKETGEYDRVVIDGQTNKIIYETKSLEDLGYFIDKMKISNRYN